MIARHMLILSTLITGFFFVKADESPTILTMTYENAELPHAWTVTEANKKTLTKYFPGIMSAGQYQVTRYVPWFTATTGEKIHFEHYAPLILNPFIGVEPVEIIIGSASPSAATTLIRFGRKIITQTQTHLKKTTCLNQPANLAHSVYNHSLDVGKFNLAQEGDIETFRNKMDTISATDPIICWGVSRGAATTFSGLASYGKEPAKWPAAMGQVKLAVLEGAFDTTSHLFPIRFPAWSADCIHGLLETFTAYKRTAKQPIDYVKEFPNDIPVIFITSLRDTTVPPQCTKALAQALAQERCLALIEGADEAKNAVYLLELQNSSHNGFVYEDPIDRKNYLLAVHSLYKQLDLPYLAEYATEEGKALLESIRITMAS